MSIDQADLLLKVPSGSLVIPKSPAYEVEDAVDPTLPRSVYFSLVVPTFNERENIAALVQLLTPLLEKATDGDYELIIVDDDSPDQTWKTASELVADYPKLRVMRRQQERGLSSAVIRGWQVARGEILGVIDGDLQHPPETLLHLLAAMQQGADLAVASRHVEGGGVSNWSAARRFLSRGAQILGLIILPKVVGRVSDPMSGYFMVRRSAIANKVMSPMGYKILLEVLGRGEVNQVTEVGYVFQERQEGESKVTRKQYWDYILHLLKLRSRGRIGRIRQKFSFPVERFLQFGLVGLSGVVVDMAMFYLFRVQLGWGIARSTILSAEVAIVNNFLWNDLWTFGDISKQQPGKQQRFKRFITFNLICLPGIILQAIVISLMRDFLGINEFVAKLTAIGVATFWNFWINLKLSWRVTQVK
jgi:dolichol-phosphate mannosyltransferase